MDTNDNNWKSEWKQQMRQQWGHGHSGHGSWRMGFAQKGWLKPVVLKLLLEKPMNGIDLMNKMQEMSMGWYKPSPGSIYPLLEQLNTEGLVSKNKDGKYELTKKYKDEFGPIGETAQMLTNMEGITSYLEELKKSDKAKLQQYKKRIDTLSSRLSKL